MNRREFLQCAALMVSGVTLARAGFALSAEQQRFLAAAPSYNTGTANYLDAEQRRIIAAMAEIIIPRTDTPGAIDAGVPNFIELMVQDWFNDQERGIFDAGLADLQLRIPQEHDASFDALPPQQQLQVMEALEDAASDSPWYEYANVQRDFISDAPFICQIKELTIWGFFTSEVGGTQVLRYEAMPMRFDGDIPLGADESSWSSRFLG